MDDLAGLDWNSTTPSTNTTSRAPNPPGTGNYFTSLKSTPPVSGRATPNNGVVSKPSSSSNLPSRTITPANDSFANLLPFNAAQSNKNLSLQDQQRLLQEQKNKQELDRRKVLGAGPGSHSVSGSDPWEGLGSGRNTPGRSASQTPLTTSKPKQAIAGPSQAPISTLPKSSTHQPTQDNDLDLLEVFGSARPIPTTKQSSPNGLASSLGTNHNAFPEDDDDPFGLGMGGGPVTTTNSKTASSREQIQKVNDDNDDDDDFLGLLGKPVSELPPHKSPSPQHEQARVSSPSPQDKAIAELVDMGFPADRSRVALETTETGMDVQAAVGWLLNQAHAEARSKTQTPVNRGRESGVRGDFQHEERTASSDSSTMPAWMRQSSRTASAQRREDSRSPANGEKDAAKIAAELGNNLFKTANSLWKTGTKKLNQAMADLNTEADTNQPKWMREARRTPQPDQVEQTRPPPARPGRQDSAPVQAQSPSLTDEAMLLEMGDARPPPRRRVEAEGLRSASPRIQSPAIPSHPRLPQDSVSRPTSQPPVAQSRSKLSRQALEDEAATAYVSSARRRKATPKPASPEPDLLFDAEQGTTPARRLQQAPAAQTTTAPTPSSRPIPKASTPAAPRPVIPPRNIPALSSIALKSSNTHRTAGAAAFKLGNYAAATDSYTNALSSLPAKHPIAIIILTNRALTNLKTGDPKASIADADSALSIIGPSKGAEETINVGPEEDKKQMAPFWGKAMMRRAEALEQLERWSDAAGVWRECVSAGVGSATSIQGRNRCEKMAAGGGAQGVSSSSSSSLPNQARKPPAPKKAPPPRPKPSALSDLDDRASAEAVTRLRAANAAAEKVDDEKFRLADSVDARLTAWRSGKEGNLRALLSSLDTVLWADSGWKKISMADLIIPAKVKINYMKGIAKVHPDKLPTTATTEQIMISGAVFSTLNEAWDRFKRENGL